MSYYIYSFEKLEVYQLSRKYKIDIKITSRLFPEEERFELTSQINKSVASISANLAEGSGKASNFDHGHFTNMAYTKGLEVIDHLNTALDFGYIDENRYIELRKKLDLILNKLNSLYKFQKIIKRY